MSETYVEITPEERSPEVRPVKGTLLIVVKDDLNVVVRNWLGEETVLGTAPDAG